MGGLLLREQQARDRQNIRRYSLVRLGYAPVQALVWAADFPVRCERENEAWRFQGQREKLHTSVVGDQQSRMAEQRAVTAEGSMPAQVNNREIDIFQDRVHHWPVDSRTGDDDLVPSRGELVGSLREFFGWPAQFIRARAGVDQDIFTRYKRILALQTGKSRQITC